MSIGIPATLSGVPTRAGYSRRIGWAATNPATPSPTSTASRTRTTLRPVCRAGCAGTYGTTDNTGRGGSWWYRSLAQGSSGGGQRRGYDTDVLLHTRYLDARPG
ncbi:MAG: hypothetical protein AUG44_10700 [Actinobacteria bacterium 13_1_20CM_3_71_11]|nr:MAG: hypothetical protein AUG44_10700 [Actinobacteria bacterium 13_1_20CM_3_71_11]